MSDHVLEIGTGWGGFAERAIGDVHMLLVKPACWREALVAPLDGGNVAVSTPHRDVHARRAVNVASLRP
jgi:hypothetical protein